MYIALSILLRYAIYIMIPCLVWYVVYRDKRNIRNALPTYIHRHTVNEHMIDGVNERCGEYICYMLYLMVNTSYVPTYDGAQSLTT